MIMGIETDESSVLGHCKEAENSQGEVERFSREGECRFMEVIYYGSSAFYIYKGITERQIAQLIEYSANKEDLDLQRFTRDGERFENKDTFDVWRAKGRVIYTLLDATENLKGILWFGKKQMPIADYSIPIHRESYLYTQAMRLYKDARGKHLAVKFGTIAGQHFSKLVEEINEASGIWIDPDADNKKSIQTFRKINPGFAIISSPNIENRIVLASPVISGDVHTKKAFSAEEHGKLSTLSYKPFISTEGYTLKVDQNNHVRFIHHGEGSLLEYILEIKQPNGFVPKSGLLLARGIEKYVKGRTVVDVGTGETGLLAIHAAKYGASRVVGVDLDEESVIWARHNGDLNGLQKIDWRVSDLFSGITQEEKFDIIISNPPQMPMQEGPSHDWGGINGREVIEKIIVDSPKYLERGGQLFMVLFDFLGIDKSYCDMPSLKDVFKASGFEMEVIARETRKVGNDGQTQRSMGDIRKQYPQFSFLKTDEALSHEMLVVRAWL